MNKFKEDNTVIVKTVNNKRIVMGAKHTPVPICQWNYDGEDSVSVIVGNKQYFLPTDILKSIRENK